MTIDTVEVNELMSDLRGEVRKGGTLQESSQRLMERFRTEFADSVVLARTYATIPYGMLPTRDQDFVRSIAHSEDMADALTEDTRVLSLLGTAGVETAWCDRYQSRNHLGIPLLSQEVVAGIPMVAALIGQLGSSVSWYEKRAPGTKTEEGFGVFTESFFVQNPGEARDYAGRFLIPAREFVETYDINTVFGVGGQFLASRIVLVCIFFSSESLVVTPPWLLRLPLMLATATGTLVANGKIFNGAK